MGNILHKISTPIADSVKQVMARGRKRKREDNDSDSCEDINDLLDKSMNTPKRKKLLSTAKYIYQALFKEERNSDVTVHALGKVWHLHKVYLSQSPYFASMFGGSWRETNEDYIHIEIMDPKISVQSLYSVFGSLYIDEVSLEPLEIISILATATLFQLESLIDKCAEVMIETTNAETAVKYYEASCEYGVKSVKESTFNWLLVNLLSWYLKSSKWLQLISIDLMQLLVTSPELCVMQTEFSLYTLLRYWMFLKIHPDYVVDDKTSAATEQLEFFANRGNSAPPFLITTQGVSFEKTFKSLRLHNLLNHHVDIKILKQDNIIPLDWMNEPLFQQWSSMLLIDHSLDKGPKKIDDKLFLESCVRCGRTILEGGYQKWRWTGFNFGIDLVFIADTRTLRIKRHHRTENERLLSLQVKRQFLIRVQLVSLNNFRQIKHKQVTTIQSIVLDKNEETMLMLLDKELTYPLLISVNTLVVSPTISSTTAPRQTIKSDDECITNTGLNGNNNTSVDL